MSGTLYHGLTGWGAAPIHPYNLGMATARDHAADLLLLQDKRGTWVSSGLEAERQKLRDARERGLLTELALGCVRSQGTLDAVLASFCSRPIPKLDPPLRVALRLGLYQVLYLDRVPDHAAVDHAVGWARKRSDGKRAGFVNGVLRSLLRDLQGEAEGPEDLRRDVPREDGSRLRFQRRVFPDPNQKVGESLASRFSMPRWLVERWLAAWGRERTEAVVRAGLTRPPLSLRPRGGAADLVALLEEREIPFEIPADQEGVLLRTGEAVVGELVERGVAAVQDLTSQRVAPLLEVAAGEDVLDLCAAPGGKALHIADLMQRGMLTACDVAPEKLKSLAPLMEQMGDVDFRIHPLKEKGALPFSPNSFDAILIDAPCSNTGVLRRRVEARWRLAAEDIDTLAELQRELLERCVPVLRAGGRIVYSTCSLEEEENERVIESFVATHPTFRAEAAYREWPAADADGGCAFVLHRSS